MNFYICCLNRKSSSLDTHALICLVSAKSRNEFCEATIAKRIYLVLIINGLIMIST